MCTLKYASVGKYTYILTKGNRIYCCTICTIYNENLNFTGSLNLITGKSPFSINLWNLNLHKTTLFIQGSISVRNSPRLSSIRLNSSLHYQNFCFVLPYSGEKLTAHSPSFVWISNMWIICVSSKWFGLLRYWCWGRLYWLLFKKSSGPFGPWYTQRLWPSDRRQATSDHRLATADQRFFVVSWGYRIHLATFPHKPTTGGLSDTF